MAPEDFARLDAACDMTPGRDPNAGDEAVHELLEDALQLRSDRLRACLVALRVAHVPLDLDTAACLVELGDRMGTLIEQALAQESQGLPAE